MKNKRFLVLGLSSALLLTGCNSVSSEVSSTDSSSHVTTSENISSEEASNTSSVEASSSVNTSEVISSDVVHQKEVAMRTMAAKSKQSAAAAENLVKTENKIGLKVASSYEGTATLNYGSEETSKFNASASNTTIVNLDTTGINVLLDETVTPEAINNLIATNDSAAYTDALAKISSVVEDEEITLYLAELTAEVAPKELKAFTNTRLVKFGEETIQAEACDLTMGDVCGAYALIANLKNELNKEGSTIVSAVTDTIKNLTGTDDLESLLPDEIKMVKALATSIVDLISSYANGEKTSEELVNSIVALLSEASEGELDLSTAEYASIRQLVADAIDYIAEIKFDEFFDASFAENTFSFEIKYANILKSVNGLFAHLLTKIGLPNGEDPLLSEVYGVLATASGAIALFAPKELTFKYAVTFNELLDIETSTEIKAKGSLPKNSINVESYDIALKGTNEFKLVNTLFDIPALPQVSNPDVTPVVE